MVFSKDIKMVTAGEVELVHKTCQFIFLLLVDCTPGDNEAEMLEWYENDVDSHCLYMFIKKYRREE